MKRIKFRCDSIVVLPQDEDLGKQELAEWISNNMNKKYDPRL